MNKLHLLLIFLLLFSSNIWSQIPNGDFELWETIQGTENPVHFITNNFPSAMYATKSENPISGDYSMSLSNLTLDSIYLIHAPVHTLFKVDKIYDTLQFSLRVDTSYNSGLTIKVAEISKEFGTKQIGSWIGAHETKETNIISIPLSHEVIDSMGIYFKLDALFHYEIEVTIDDMSLIKTNTTSVNQEQAMDFKLFPNPITDKLYIESSDPDNSLKNVQIFNLNGQLIFESKFRDPEFECQLNSISAGMYFVHIYSELGKLLYAERLVIQ